MIKYIKKLYKKDRKLAIEVAHALGYKIVSDKKSTVIDTLSKQLFNQINEQANSKGLVFKSSADEFEVYLKKFLARKLQ